MTHQFGLRIEGPRLGEVCLELQELRIGILEYLLSLVVPLLACHYVIERYDITSLGQRRFPTDGVQLGRRTCVDIGIAHLRNEVVLHRDCQIGVDSHNVLEGLRLTIHKLILNG